MHPSFEQFVAALREPAQRPGIRLSISDEDAAALLTRADWANDYYSRWIALFPAAAVVPAAAPTPSFGPPPNALPSVAPAPAFNLAAADAPVWAAAPRRRLTSPARIAIIAVITIAALWAVAGVVNLALAATHTAATAIVNAPRTATTPSSGASSGTQDDPVVFHGLTQTEYDLIEAVLAPQGHTLEQAVAQGADDAELQGIAVSTESSTAKTCSDGKALDNGFENATFRASFIAGYEVAQKATPEQAAAVYDSLAAYCDNH